MLTYPLMDNISARYSLFYDAIPELEATDESKAIITHLLNSPGDRFPFCSEELARKIISVAKTEKVLNATKYRFIDLFAGIGGFHLAFSSCGCKCIFASEWDPYAKQTYEANYGIVPFGDIKQIKADTIPDHDILCAGFPCQPFSIAGISKKNSMGRATGFEDKTQGTLFFDVARIIKEKRPKAFFLENVKNLLSHDKGNTWRIIKDTLENELNYCLFFEIVDGKEWVPQHRERVFIVGFDSERYGKDLSFTIPLKPEGNYVYKTLDTIISDSADSKYTLSAGTWEALKRHKQKHKDKGNGFGYTLLPFPITPNTITATISARYYKDGAEILVPVAGQEIPRRLTVSEAMSLQGFNPNQFKFPVTDIHAYKQIGNSVVVPAIKSTAQTIIEKLEELDN